MRTSGLIIYLPYNEEYFWVVTNEQCVYLISFQTIDADTFTASDHYIGICSANSVLASSSPLPLSRCFVTHAYVSHENV